MLRWHVHLVAAARAFADGRPLPPLPGDPPAEIEEQATAFTDAVQKARARESLLAEAVQTNMQLSRELHHRVKNNLQILSSLANRQQRRTPDPAVARALAESRAQLLAISLVYRFLKSPGELNTIDLAAYLRELTNQLDLLLGGDLHQQRFTLDLEPATASADEVGALGLVVAECFIGASRTPPKDGGGWRMNLHWRGPDLAGPWRLSIEGSEAVLCGAIDLAMIRETARQLKASLVQTPEGHLLMEHQIKPAVAAPAERPPAREAHTDTSAPPDRAEARGRGTTF